MDFFLPGSPELVHQILKSYLWALVVRLVLEVLELHLVLQVQGFLGDPQSHLLPVGLIDPADLGTRYPCPPVITETNMKAVNQHRMRETAQNDFQQQNRKWCDVVEHHTGAIWE